MGMTAYIYRNDLGDCTNDGASSQVKSVCVINMDGPFKPGKDCPAFELIEGRGGRGHAILKPVETKPGIGPMFGGNFAYCCDSRFGEAVRKLTGSPHYGAVPIFDRWESPEEYEALSR